MHPIVLGRDPLDQAAHALLGRVYLAEIADLAATLTIRDSHGVTRLRNIDPDKNFCRMFHGSSSCDEDRLGPPEQPSLEQSRASHLKHRNGHRALLLFGVSPEPTRCTPNRWATLSFDMPDSR
jgi:hypothetical protein